MAIVTDSRCTIRGTATRPYSAAVTMPFVGTPRPFGTRHESAGIVSLLLGAGRDAVAHISAGGTVLLPSHRAQMAESRPDPALISMAAEFAGILPIYQTGAVSVAGE
ncbi:hypothetical protein C1I98_03945 [Spongiactinospora gelatinilytica]|uniref:Uncharacterized protein n=1 Tax=Spongiactinospora gelatinilytica TaxID=2666298 RepID=A0A2W2GXH4_9ACTN|nr:hypothetical protein [Spongiactinospora gelatinilytica]PZG54416.1 hypothetical protein C1I98_03945 [Spongiactinospora gelatinilytica]